MKVLMLLFAALYFTTAALAQDHAAYMVKAGTTIKESIPPGVLYYYQGFQKGRIFFKDGHTAGGSMNYHRMLDELQFIDPKGDTLAVDNEPTIQLAVIGSDSFYYQEGFLQLLRSEGGVKLAKKQCLQLVDRQKRGGYGEASSGSAITTLKSFYDGQRLYDLTVKEDLVFSVQQDYYFGDQFNRFVLATKKNILDLFAKHENAVKQYLQAGKVDFKKAEDMEKLRAFLAQL